MKLFKLIPIAVVSARQLNTTASHWTKTTYVPDPIVNVTTPVVTTTPETEDFVNPCYYRIDDDFYQLSSSDSNYKVTLAPGDIL